MTLYFIGLGIFDEKDISLKGLETIKKCDFIYLDCYTAILSVGKEELEKVYGKKIILADRDLVENHAEETILKNAIENNVAFLVVGDPMAATTHIDLKLRARGLGIKTIIINSSSVFSAIGITGLQLYKFGKTTTIPFPENNFIVETPYYVIKNNLENDMHTLVLLDLRPDENRFMTINDALKYLIKIEDIKKEGIFNDERLCVGCTRLGSLNPCIKAGKLKDIIREDFGPPMHLLIIPTKLHFKEEEALEEFMIKTKDKYE